MGIRSPPRSYDKLIKLWDIASRKRKSAPLKITSMPIYALAFTPDGKRLISGAADRTIKIWNVETGERLYTLSDAQDGINCLALDPDRATTWPPAGSTRPSASGIWARRAGTGEHPDRA